MIDGSPSTPPRRTIGRSLILPALFFVGGVAATGWVLTSTDFGTQLVSQPAPEPIAIDPVKMAAPPPAAVAPPPMADDVAARIAAIEGRLARAEASGGSSGAGLSTQLSRVMLAIAARRALEAGRGLGGLQGELEQQFGADAPYLVAAIASAAKQPVTLTALNSEFASLAPALSGSGDKWWARISNSFSNLVTVRDGKTKSDDPAALVVRAEAALKMGNVAAAVEAVSQTPNRAIAADWIAKAKRYAAAMQAVDALEAKAYSTATTEAAAPVMVLPEPKPAPVMGQPDAI
jgi:hypothetical protein